jgi:RNA polymerase sigma factor (sigma-70 family)
VQEQNRSARFEQVVLPHLPAAYNLARWLVQNEQDAEDVVQEAYLRAFRFFDGFRGGDSRAWMLTIVRHTAYTWLQHKRGPDLTTPFDEELHSTGCDEGNPEHLVIQRADRHALREALAELPTEFREVIVLRELEGLSYKEIAGIAAVPLGTVMSRLARARKRLQGRLGQRPSKET